MSDERLRALKHRFEETGSPEDEAAWVREQVRCGELRRESVLLAASLGEAAATSIFGAGEVPQIRFAEGGYRIPQPRFYGSMKRDDPWPVLVYSLGRESYLRLVLALGRITLPLWPGENAGWGARAFAAGEAYVRDQTPEHFLDLRELDEQSPAAESNRASRAPGLAPDYPVDTLADRVAWAYKGVLPDPELLAYYAAGALVRWAGMLLEGTVPEVSPTTDRALSFANTMVLCEALNGAMLATSQGEALSALRVEVGPWLLGRRDPLRERGGRPATTIARLPDPPSLPRRP